MHTIESTVLLNGIKPQYTFDVLYKVLWSGVHFEQCFLAKSTSGPYVYHTNTMDTEEGGYTCGSLTLVWRNPTVGGWSTAEFPSSEGHSHGWGTAPAFFCPFLQPPAKHTPLMHKGHRHQGHGTIYICDRHQWSLWDTIYSHAQTSLITIMTGFMQIYTTLYYQSRNTKASAQMTCLWTPEGNQSTQRKPTWGLGNSSNSTLDVR